MWQNNEIYLPNFYLRKEYSLTIKVPLFCHIYIADMHIIYYLGGWGGDRVIERETESGDIVNQLMLCREYFFFMDSMELKKM